jgi:eukaryotic-like serine/threonine-protein kinase
VVPDDDGRLTAPGAVLGTPLYMAPEQYRAAADQDQRVDIYALGATVFHALSGRPPFGGNNIWEMMAQKMERSPRSLPAVSRETIALVEAMMAPDPRDRIGSYEDLMARIDGLPMMRDIIPPDPILTIQRRWGRYAVAAVGSLAVAAFGVHIGLPSAPVSALNRPAGRYVSGGLFSLLDSNSLASWMPFAAGGNWHFEKDAEGAEVLTGTGFTRRVFDAPDNYQLTLGLDLYKADAAEIHFGLRPNGQRHVLRVTKAGATLGTKDGDKNAFRALNNAAPFPPEKWFEGRSPYLEVRLERAGGWWSTRFNGVDVGRVADDGSRKSPEVRLNAEGGAARVDSVILGRLELMD